MIIFTYFATQVVNGVPVAFDFSSLLVPAIQAVAAPQPDSKPKQTFLSSLIKVPSEVLLGSGQMAEGFQRAGAGILKPATTFITSLIEQN